MQLALLDHEIDPVQDLLAVYFGMQVLDFKQRHNFNYLVRPSVI
jgi:hypothetical protein